MSYRTPADRWEALNLRHFDRLMERAGMSNSPRCLGCMKPSETHFGTCDECQAAVDRLLATRLMNARERLAQDIAREAEKK